MMVSNASRAATKITWPQSAAMVGAGVIWRVEVRKLLTPVDADGTPVRLKEQERARLTSQQHWNVIAYQVSSRQV
jgi:hypothetical protein